MCGIFFSISSDQAVEPDAKTWHSLCCRGPDVNAIVKIQATNAGDASSAGKLITTHLTFCSSVLALRGDHITSQPLQDDVTGSILCWNGEAWKIDGHSVPSNDSTAVFNVLLLASRKGNAEILEALSKIQGPFAFVFYEAISQAVYYGRDRLGRRSLMVNSSTEQRLTLCSISADQNTSNIEVDASSVHSIAILSEPLTYRTHPWPVSTSINREMPTAMLPDIPSPHAVRTLIDCLSDSLRLRVLSILRINISPEGISKPKVAILFSGGLDCSLLARITHNLLPSEDSIDLLNVAFENPRALAHLPDTADAYESCPDRITGRASFAALASSCLIRQWRFVAINIPYHILVEHRPIIQSLMAPHDTEMDISIASALYFAARGIGETTTAISLNTSAEPYTTPARVLLSGLGADELFGGYARHAAAFIRASYTGLVDELDLDIQRISHRNLGRDDRVMSHWAKEVRYPYLDEDFAHFALQLPVWEKTGFREGKHIPKHFETMEKPILHSREDLPPDKMLLRLAAWDLGLPSVAAEKKRAIQFGARTAKMEIGRGRKKGTDKITD